MTSTTIIFDLIGRDGASRAFRTAGASATASAARMVTAGNKMTAVGRTMTHAFTLPALAVAAGSVKMATDFNSAMTRIQTQAGASGRDVETLSAQVLALGGKVQQGPVELANALYHLKSVGLDNAKAMKALVQASHLASVGNADLEETTNAVAGAWRTGIQGATNFKGAVSTLNAIIGAGNMTMEDLNGALGTGFLPSAKTFGLSLHDVGAALALFTDEGVPAEVAATRLRMTFSLLGAPSAKAAGQLKTIGLNAKALAQEMRSDGLVGAIGLLKDHLQGLSQVDQAQLLSRAFGGGRSSSAILSMINNFDVLKQKEDQVTAGMSKFGAAVSKQAQTPQAQFKTMLSTLETLGVQIGNELLPDAIKLANGVEDLVTWFAKLPAPVKETVGGLTAFLAAGGPLLLMGGALVRSVMSIGTAMTFMKEQAIGTRIQLAGLSIAENKLRFGGAIAGMAALTASTQTSNKTLQGLLQVAGGAAMGFAAGGPLGAAVGGAAGLFTVLAQHMHSASDAAKASRADYSKLGDTLDALTGSITADTRKFVENQLARSGTLKDLATYGISTRTAISAILGEGSARRVVSAALKSQSAAIADQRHQIALLTAANVADEKKGTLNPQAQAARKKQIDQLNAQIAAEQNVADAVRKGIGATKEQVLAARRAAAATADYTGKLKGLPKAARTEIQAVGIVPTVRAIAALAKKYDLTPKQIQTVISASGVNTTVGQIKKVEDGLTAVNNVRPNLSAYKAQLQNQIDQAGGIARSGGTSVGYAMTNGLEAALAADRARIAAQSADLVSNAILAARKAADAHSPSRKMIKLGQDLGDGLIVGLRSREMPLQKMLSDLQGRVQSWASKLKGAVSNRDQFAAGFQTFATSAFGADFGSDANGNPVAPTAAGIVAYQQQQAAQAAAVRDDVRKLVGMHLSPALLKQLQGAGAAGMAEITALASATPSQIRAFNAANKQTQDAYRSAGMVAGNSIYGGQIQRDRANLAEAKRLRDAVREGIKDGFKDAELEVRGDKLVLVIKNHKVKTGNRPTGIG